MIDLQDSRAFSCLNEVLAARSNALCGDHMHVEVGNFSHAVQQFYLCLEILAVGEGVSRVLLKFHSSELAAGEVAHILPAQRATLVHDAARFVALHTRPRVHVAVDDRRDALPAGAFTPTSPKTVIGAHVDARTGALVPVNWWACKITSPSSG